MPLGESDGESIAPSQISPNGEMAVQQLDNGAIERGGRGTESESLQFLTTHKPYPGHGHDGPSMPEGR